jgi:hypothetical protein
MTHFVTQHELARATQRVRALACPLRGLQAISVFCTVDAKSLGIQLLSGCLEVLVSNGPISGGMLTCMSLTIRSLQLTVRHEAHFPRRHNRCCSQEFQAALEQEAEKAVEYAIANACKNGSTRSVSFVLTDFDVVVSHSAALIHRASS